MIMGSYNLNENGIDKIELGWKYNEKALQAKQRGDTEEEIQLLKEAVSRGVETKYSYNRLAVLLRKEGKLEEAIHVQKKHLEVMKRFIENSPKGSWNKTHADEKMKPILSEIKKMEDKLKNI